MNIDHDVTKYEYFCNNLQFKELFKLTQQKIILMLKTMVQSNFVGLAHLQNYYACKYKMVT